MTSMEMQKLVGHIVASLTLRRECMSLLHACYTFINRVEEHQRVPLWDSARSELRSVLALLPAIAAPMEPTWCGKVLAVDASPYAFGVVAGRWSSEQAGAVGRRRERTRWRGPLACTVAPREHALAGSQSEEGRPEFPEVPKEQLAATVWSVVRSQKWHRHSNILNLEGSAVLWGVRHLCKSQTSQFHRHLILSDNLAVVAAIGKGRAAQFGLNGVCRAIAAHAIFAECRFVVRWIPSEYNPADLPARQTMTTSQQICSSQCRRKASFHYNEAGSSVQSGDHGLDDLTVQGRQSRRPVRCALSVAGSRAPHRWRDFGRRGALRQASRCRSRAWRRRRCSLGPKCATTTSS